MTKDQWLDNKTKELFVAILLLKTADEAAKFFRDLLTQKEIAEFANRWRVAGLLDQRVRYTEIAKETSMSSTTIARIQKWLKKGAGGYKLILERLKEKR